MSEQQKRSFSDLLFGVQIAGALAFLGFYIQRATVDVTGSSVAQVFLVWVYLWFHLSLGISAHREKPVRANKQAVATYVLWLVFVEVLVLATWTNPDYRWSGRDTEMLKGAAYMTLAILAFGALRRLPVADPMMKAFLAIAYKSVPQFLLVFKILAEGGTGHPAWSVALGHFTILVRLGQVWFMPKGRNRTWLGVSEAINELSWLAATVAWLVV